MAFNGSGIFQRLMSWIDDRNNGIKITADRHDDEDDNFADGLSNCIVKDGQSTTTARIPFAQGLSIPDGSTNPPGLNFINDTDTGIHRTAANEIALVAGGGWRLKATSTSVVFGKDALPATSDGATLGSSSFPWSDLYLANGGTVNFNSGDIVITGASGGLAFAGASNGYTFDSNVSPAAAAGGYLGLNGTGWAGVYLASGGFVDFNGTSLDAYEEGTFTPGLKFAGNSSGMTGSFVGRYQKVGNRVTMTINISLSAKGASTGNAEVTSLPYTPQTITTPLAAYINGGATLTGQHLQPIVNGTSILLRYLNGATSGNLTNSHFQDTTSLNLSGTYEATT